MRWQLKRRTNTLNAAVLLASAAATAIGQTAITWTASGNGLWSNVAGWSGGVVPVNTASQTFDVTLDGSRTIFIDSGTPLIFAVNDLILRQPTTLEIQFGRRLTVNQDCSIAGVLSVSGEGSFNATTTGARLESTGRLRTTAGGRIDLNVGTWSAAPFASNETLFSASGVSANSVAAEINLTGLNSFTYGGGGGRWTHTISATDGGIVRLGGLRSIQAISGEDDVLAFVANGGGRIVMDQLETIGATGNGNDRVRFDVGAGSSAVLPALARASRMEVRLTGTGTLAMPSLQRLEYSDIDLAGSQVLATSTSLSVIDGTRISVRDGARWGVGQSQLSASSYSIRQNLYGTFTLFSASGSGSVLDLSSMTSVDVGWDDGWDG